MKHTIHIYKYFFIIINTISETSNVAYYPMQSYSNRHKTVLGGENATVMMFGEGANKQIIHILKLDTVEYVHEEVAKLVCELSYELVISCTWEKTNRLLTWIMWV